MTTMTLAHPAASFLWLLSLFWRSKQSSHAPHSLSGGKRVEKKFIQFHCCGAPAVLPPGERLLATSARTRSMDRRSLWFRGALEVRPKLTLTTSDPAAARTPSAPLCDPTISCTPLTELTLAPFTGVHRQLFVVCCFLLLPNRKTRYRNDMRGREEDEEILNKRYLHEKT